ADATVRPPCRTTSGTGTDAGLQSKRLEVLVRNLGERRQRNRRLARLVFIDEPLEQAGYLLAVAIAEPGVLHRLRTAAAVEVDRRQPARQGLHECIRIRVVLRRGDEDVMSAKQCCKGRRGHGRDVTDLPKLGGRVADERELVAVPIQVALEPLIRRSALPRVV